MLKLNYFLADIFILSAEKQPIKLSWRKIEWLRDDHFRNHGFLLTAKGWTLSPAYDMNPTLNEYQSLLISADSNKADLSILLDACEDYMLNRKTAEKIILEVIDAVKNWRELAIRLGLSKREMEMFAGVLDERIITEIVG